MLNFATKIDKFYNSVEVFQKNLENLKVCLEKRMEEHPKNIARVETMLEKTQEMETSLRFFNSENTFKKCAYDSAINNYSKIGGVLRSLKFEDDVTSEIKDANVTLKESYIDMTKKLTDAKWKFESKIAKYEKLNEQQRDFELNGNQEEIYQKKEFKNLQNKIEGFVEYVGSQKLEIEKENPELLKAIQHEAEFLLTEVKDFRKSSGGYDVGYEKINSRASEVYKLLNKLAKNYEGEDGKPFQISAFKVEFDKVISELSKKHGKFADMVNRESSKEVQAMFLSR